MRQSSEIQFTVPIPAPGEGKRGESGHLGYLLRQAGATHRLRMERALSGLDMTPPQFVVLTMIQAYPGLSNADLARLAFLTPQTTSLIVANLLKAGLILRQAHPVHGRILQMELTELGRDRLRAARERALALEAELMEGFSPEDEAVVRRWLVRVATARTA